MDIRSGRLGKEEIHLQIDIGSVFQQMIVLFLIMGIGYVGGKTRVMTIDGNKTLSRMVNCITNPCNILYSALCAERSLSTGQVLSLIAIAAGMYLVLVLVAQIVPALLRVPREQKGQYKFMMIFSNIGYMGIPVISAIYGPSAVFIVSVVIMVFYVVMYTYGIFLIREDKQGGFRFKDLLTPMMVSSVVGLLSYLAGIRVPTVIGNTLDTVRKVTTPCAMLIIGCALSTVPLKDVFGNWRLYIVSGLKLVAMPLLGYVLLKPVVSDPVILGVFVAVMGMPIASNFTMLSAQYDKDQRLAAAAVFITTLLSVVSIPIMMGILFAG